MHHPIPGDNVTVNSLKLLKKYTNEKVSSIFLMLFFTLNKLIEEKCLVFSSVSSNENNCVFT